MDSLQTIIITLLFVIVGVYWLPEEEIDLIQTWALVGTWTIVLMFVMLVSKFDLGAEKTYQFFSSTPIAPEYSIFLTFGVDGLNLCLLLLTTVIVACSLFSVEFTKKPKYKELVLAIVCLELFIILAFLSTNALSFYIFFESILIPMVFIIGHWGARERRIHAAFYFFLYTLIGSFFFLYGLLYLFFEVGSLDNEVLIKHILSAEKQNYLFIFLFIPFAVKIPMYPFHLWLPEAHVEAPTAGSIILASVLLKLGGYGFIRYTLPIVPAACTHFQNYIYVLAGISVLFASIAATRQTDLKRFVAYSSIAHMNIIVLGIFSGQYLGISGGTYLMIAHGIASTGLFFCVGVLYDRYHTRSIQHFSGVAENMPLFCHFFFIFICANMGFPLTANFLGEFLTFAGIYEKNAFMMTFAAISVLLGAAYSIWVYNRVVFGTLKTEKENIAVYADLNRREFLILSVLSIALIILGVSGTALMELVDPVISQTLEIMASKKS